MSVCVKGNDVPPLKGRKPRFRCKRCELVARKKKHLCKPRKIKST